MKPYHIALVPGDGIGKEVIPALREHRSALVTGKEVTPWPQ